MANQNYCSSSPWCEDDQVCRCEAWDEYERDETYAEKILVFIQTHLNIHFSDVTTIDNDLQ